MYVKLIAKKNLPSKSKFTSSDAQGAFCTKCKTRVSWKKGESHGVKQHMYKFHKYDYNRAKAEEELQKRTELKISPVVCPADFLNEFHFRVAKWIAETRKSISIVEQQQLQDIVDWLHQWRKIQGHSSFTSKSEGYDQNDCHES